MPPAPVPSVHRIEFEVPWPPWTAYAYFLPTDEPILVDAGGPGAEAWAALENGLAEAGHEPADVEHLLVTHPHTDHDGQVADLVETAAPTVYAPVGVRERLARDPEELAGVVRQNARRAGVPDLDSAVEQAVDSLRRNGRCLPPTAIDVDVGFDGPLSVGGLTVDPVHVPGHQAEQAAYRVDGALFAGDALVEPFRPAALHAGFDRGYRECVDAFYEGLARLDALDVDRVYPGHGPVFEDAAGAVRRAREGLDDLVADCRRTLSEVGEASAHEVTEARVEDPRRMAFAVFESVGALSRLERNGAVDSTVTDEGVRRYSLAE